MNSRSECAPDGHIRDRKRAERLEQIREDGPSALATFKRAYSGKSLRAAIDAHCLECLGMDRAAIRDCTAPACPLWAVRPYQTKRAQ